jgi:nucleoside-diphosphate-sugar epimerase
MSLPQSEVLVTGPLGCLGSRLVESLVRSLPGRERLSQPRAELRIRCLAAPGQEFIPLTKLSDHIRITVGDIRRPQDCERFCDGAQGAVLFHAEGTIRPSRVSEFSKITRDGTENLLRAALAAKVRKAIYVSCSAVLGVPKSNPVTEETPPAPGEAYGRAKLEGERLCNEFTQRGLDVTIIRPRTIMGHGRLGIFQILFEWIREGRNIPVLGCGDNRYQFVHAEDLAEACILAAARPGAAIYNCGTDRFGTMRETLEHLCAHAKTGSHVRSVPMAPAVALMKATSALGLSPLGAYHALMYGRSLYFDIGKAQKELAWQPRYSNNEMFVQSYDWYLKNREFILGASGASQHRSAVKQGILALVKHLL